MGYFAFTKSFEGMKIARVREVDTENVIGASGSKYGTFYRYPASFLIPPDDPQYNKEGNSAMGTYGYMLNSRCWLYDIGLALLCFTESGDHALCQEIISRLALDQHEDGGFNFSYDLYIGQVLQNYTRVGSVGWVLWGMAYYMLKTGDITHMDVLVKGADWLLSHQVTKKLDFRYGLLTGGYGSYTGTNYTYDPSPITWCSTEHQCSALQALHGAALVTGDRKYSDAANLIKSSLFTKLYDPVNKRFYQGCNSTGIDSAWALDCTTWAGSTTLSILEPLTVPPQCRQTAYGEYLVQGASIVQNTDPKYYNQTYSITTTVEGFKPYSDRDGGYTGSPSLVWTEGTLGYVALCIAIGNITEATRFLDSVITLQECDGSTGGVIYTTATYADLPWEFHVWESVVSSAWLYLLINAPECLFPIVSKRAKRVYRMT